MKQIARVDADKVVLKDVSRSPQRTLSDQVSHVNEASVARSDLMRSQVILFKDVSRSPRRPLSDSTNVCCDVQDSIGHHLHQQQRKLLHPLLARRRSSCVRHLSAFITKIGSLLVLDLGFSLDHEAAVLGLCFGLEI